MSINELRRADRDDDQRIMPTLGEAATSTLVSMLVLSTAMSQGAFAQAGDDDDNRDGGSAAGDPFDGAEMIDGSVALPTLVVMGDGEARNIQTRPAPLTRIPTSVQDTPQLINVIGEQTIEERADTSLSDVMRNVPAVTMNAGEGGGSTPRGDNFNIRGFSA